MKPHKASPSHFEIEAVRLTWLAAFVSVFSFLFYQRHGDVLLYGDAVAHINIARRVFDSQTPGLLQLGTVWLPLPHLLILPFITPIKLWQAGTGGSIPSMAGYILGVLGIFRLARTTLRRKGKDENKDDNNGDASSARALAWAAAVLYAANPNLIYMQATAMGESLYLAFFIWGVLYFAEFARADATGSSSLIKCGLCLAAACLTRYDGWFLAILLIAAALIITFRRSQRRDQKDSLSRPSFYIPLVKFLLVASAAPVLWFAYNAIVYRNPLEFANGPYSAKAIESKTHTVNPAKDDIRAAASYFLKAAELNVGNANWQGRLWLALVAAGSVIAAFTGRGRVALFLWVPLPFYALCIAYGSVVIFVPAWWPLSYYNLRYGLQLLPAVAIFTPLAVAVIVESAMKIPRLHAWRQWAGGATFLVVVLLAALSYTVVWRTDPICYREALINNRGRVALEAQIERWLELLPKNTTFLMYLGEHVGAFEQAGIPLRRVINEGNHRVWMQPSDPQGLWERALADPAAYANFIIGFEGDPVWNAAKQHHLTALVEIHTTGQAPAAIFQGHPEAPNR